MSILKKIILRVQIEIKFLLEQKWGLKKPSDINTIAKYKLKKILPKNPVIIDCGAHIGSDSVELAKIFSNSSIHCFEPIPELFHLLKNNTRKYFNICCYQLALSNKDGTVRMHVSSGASNASSSILQPKDHIIEHPDTFFERTVEVKTSTLDHWAKSNNITRIDFLWLDMQGYEFEMLKASEVFFPSLKAIYTEVSLREVYSGSVLYPDFKIWMESKGFRVIDEAIPEGTDMGNALFVNTRFWKG